MEKKKRKQSPEVIARHNQKNEVREMMRTIRQNFGTDAIFLSLVFDVDTETPRDDRKELRQFIRKCADEHKKNGAAFRYLYTIDTADVGMKKVQRKIIINMLVDNNLDDFWYTATAKNFFTNAIAIPTSSLFFRYEIFEKYLREKDRNGTEQRARRWACSRNLKRGKR